MITNLIDQNKKRATASAITLHTMKHYNLSLVIAFAIN